MTWLAITKYRTVRTTTGRRIITNEALLARLEMIVGHFVVRWSQHGLDRGRLERVIAKVEATPLYAIRLIGYLPDGGVEHGWERLTPADGYWYVREFESALHRELGYLATDSTYVGVFDPKSADRPPGSIRMTPDGVPWRTEAILIGLACMVWVLFALAIGRTLTAFVIGIATAELLASYWLMLFHSKKSTGELVHRVLQAMTVVFLAIIAVTLLDQYLPQTTSAIGRRLSEIRVGDWSSLLLAGLMVLIPPLPWYLVERISDREGRVFFLKVSIAVSALAAAIVIAGAVSGS